MLFSGQSIGAAAAVDCDLALEMVDSEGLIDAAAAVLHNLTGAMKSEARQVKRRPVASADRQAFDPTMPDGSIAERELLDVLVAGAALPLEEGLALETEAFCRLAGTEQSQEKIAAFFNRKK
jgi:enoyl-CoA hydratase